MQNNNNNKNAVCNNVMKMGTIRANCNDKRKRNYGIEMEAKETKRLATEESIQER